MMFRMLKMTALVVSVVTLSAGCSSVPYYSLDEMTEERIAKLSFPAESENMKILRSKFIAAAVALYATDAISRHSGERSEKDAQAVHGMLKRVNSRLKALVAGQTKMPHYQRVSYIRLALRLVDQATVPARRAYREKAFGLLSLSGGGLAVGAAKTAFQALSKVAELEIYRQALLNDINGYYHGIMASTGQKKSGDPDYVALLTALTGAKCKADGGVKDEKRTLFASKDWTDHVSPFLLSTVCVKGGAPLAAEKMIAYALDLGHLNNATWVVDTTNSTIKAVYDAAMTAADEMLDDVCWRLAEQAGLDFGTKKEEMKCFEKT